ncbi:hypothetical protein BJF84_05730 [Rhodococcus sp. CUA-806]|nr:hypothetical protein BJF84_05730 [Rhodococcus sp. CUA-806]
MNRFVRADRSRRGIVRRAESAAATVLIAIAVMLAFTSPATAQPSEALYIAHAGAGQVISIPTTGGTPTILAEGLDYPAGVVVVQATPPEPCWGSVCLPSSGS